MAEMVEKGLLFTFDELKILLFACGIREIDGVYMPEKDFSEEIIIHALHHMAERGIIQAGDEEFTIREDVAQMLGIMGKPETAYIWRPDEETASEAEFFCYTAGEKAVVSERYWKKKDTVKLRLFSKEELEEWKGRMRNDYRGC